MDLEGICNMTVKYKSRGIQSMAVVLLLTVIGTVAVDTSTLTCDAPLTGDRTAGIIQKIHSMESDALSSVSVQDSQVVLVAAGEDAATAGKDAPVVEAAVAEDPWSNKLMANVESFLYVRDGAGEQCNAVGKMYRGSVAEVVGHENGWTQIVSGNVNGYVKDEYCVTGQEAYQLASAVCETKATVQASGLRIRSDAGEWAGILKGASRGEKLTVDTQAPATEGWVAVKTGKRTGYVSAQYVEVAMDCGTAITLEEERALIAAQKAAAEEAARKAAEKRRQAERVQNAAVASSCDDVTLLAALIQCEAGSEPYEGQLAVGAVVVNRMRSGRFPNTVPEVIYQKGQFRPAGDAKLTRVLSQGPSSSCVQAAREALGGADNTGGAVSFRRAGSGRSGIVIGHHVFF